MEASVQTFWVSKSGNSDDECQDAHFPIGVEPQSSCEDQQYYAVSDGASEAIHSKYWAGLLVKGWAGGLLRDESFIEQLQELGNDWTEYAGQSSETWWLEEKLRQGSFATFLGLELSNGDGCATWKTTSVGDSCFFVIRGGRVIRRGPLSVVEEFQSAPYLVGTSPGANTELASRIVRHSGTLERSDEIVLATDALAQWIFGKLDQSELWPVPNSAIDGPLADFRAWIDSLRSSGQMRNDDVTLLSVSIVQL